MNAISESGGLHRDFVVGDGWWEGRPPRANLLLDVGDFFEVIWLKSFGAFAEKVAGER
jgi:hypothetical protein